MPLHSQEHCTFWMCLPCIARPPHGCLPSPFSEHPRSNTKTQVRLPITQKVNTQDRSFDCKGIWVLFRWLATWGEGGLLSRGQLIVSAWPRGFIRSFGQLTSKGVQLSVTFFLLGLLSFEREGKRMSRKGREGIPNSVEPDSGLELTNCEIITWAQIESGMPNRLSHLGAPVTFLDCVQTRWLQLQTLPQCPDVVQGGLVL